MFLYYSYLAEPLSTLGPGHLNSHSTWSELMDKYRQNWIQILMQMFPPSFGCVCCQKLLHVPIHEIAFVNNNDMSFIFSSNRLHKKVVFRRLSVKHRSAWEIALL